jgi:hypothetical protein
MTQLVNELTILSSDNFINAVRKQKPTVID